MNPNLGASARTLQDWLFLAREAGIEPLICLQKAGDLSRWLAQNQFEFHINAMPILDRPHALKWSWSVCRLLAWLRGRRIDVMHCYEHDLWPFAWPLRRVMRKPTICHFHFSVGREYCEWAFGKAPRRPDFALWTSQQQRKDSSDAVAGLLATEGQSIVPLGLDLSRFGQGVEAGVALREKLGIADDEVVIGSACALRHRKRVDDFIELVVELSARHARVRGLLAGGPVPAEAAYGERISRRLGELQASGKLHWLGHMEPIEPVYHACNIFVSTSEYETFGMSVLEAMACSRPAVAYRGGSVGEVVGDAGLIVETGDLAALTAAVERLVIDAKLRRRLGEAARERVAEQFNPRKSFEQLVGIYESLVVSRKAKPSAVAAL